MLNPDSSSLTAKLPIALEPQPPPSHPPSEQHCSSPGVILTPSKKKRKKIRHERVHDRVDGGAQFEQAGRLSAIQRVCLLYSCTDGMTEYRRLITTRCSAAESPDLARLIVNADQQAKPSHYSYIGRAPNSYLRNINIPRAVQDTEGIPSQGCKVTKF